MADAVSTEGATRATPVINIDKDALKNVDVAMTAALRVNPEDTSPGAEAARLIRERMQKDNQSAHTVLTAIKDLNPITGAQIDQLGNKINKGYNEATKTIDRTKDEQKRYDTVVDNAKLVKLFQETGYAELPDKEQKDIFKRVEQTVKSNPHFAGLKGEHLTQAVNELLQHPQFTTKLLEKFSEIKDLRTDSIDPAIKKAYTEAGLNLTKIQDDLDIASKQLTDVGNELDTYLDKSGITGGGEGAKHKTYQEIIGKIVALRPLKDLTFDKDTVEAQIATINADRRKLKTPDELAESDGKLEAARGKLKKYEDDIAQHRALEARKAEIERQRAELEADKKRLQKDRVDLINQARHAHSVLISAQVDYEQEQRRSQPTEQELADRMQAIFSETTTEFLADQIEEALKAQAKVLEERIKDETDENKKKALEGAKKRWCKEVTDGKGNILQKLEEGAIRGDFQVLIANGDKGAEIVKMRVLTESGLTEEQAKELLNSDFNKELDSVITETLIARKAQADGLTEAEQAAIKGSAWGAEAIKKAVEGDEALLKKFQAQFDALKKKGLIPEGATLKDLNWLIFVLKILGIVVGVGLAAGGLGPLGGAVGGALHVAAGGISKIGEHVTLPDLPDVNLDNLPFNKNAPLGTPSPAVPSTPPPPGLDNAKP